MAQRSKHEGPKFERGKNQELSEVEYIFSTTERNLALLVQGHGRLQKLEAMTSQEPALEREKEEVLTGNEVSYKNVIAGLSMISEKLKSMKDMAQKERLTKRRDTMILTLMQHGLVSKAP
ncbi:hypothetical protein L0Y34_01430 [Candidatus Parcubacteria bacterium]|nr:hypothetical protein [Candidatus Parcubacteria bacterium]